MRRTAGLPCCRAPLNSATRASPAVKMNSVKIIPWPIAAIGHGDSAEAIHHERMLAAEAGCEHRCGLDKLQTVIDAANLENDSLGCRP